jgi:hypothetical protein
VTARGRFVAAGLWSVVIVCTVPIGPRLTGSLIEEINEIAGIDYGGDVIAGTIGCILAVWLMAALVRVLRHPAIRTPRNLCILAAASAAYIWIYRQMESPGEKIHFLEYGVLARLLLPAWRERVQSRMIWPLLLLPAFLLGVADEWIQHLTPWFRSFSPFMRELVSQRYGEFHDVCWNLASITLPAVVLAIFEPRRDAPARAWEIKATRGLTLAFLAFLCGFLLMTQEYGVFIADPRGYNFRTRTAGPDALLAEDVAPSAALAAELALQGPFNYDTFQLRHSAAAEPRVNEFRVHLFRRNRYLAYYAHATLRRSLAGLEPPPAEGAWPDLDRALREYIPEYDAVWLMATYGDTIGGDAGWERELAGWIRGESHAWGQALHAHYLAKQRAKIEAGDIPSRLKALEDLRVAERENRILEDYFPRLLEGGGSRWSDAFRDEVDFILLEGPEPAIYESAVAKRIFTGIKREGILGMTAIAILLVSFWPARAPSRRIILLLALLVAPFFGLLLRPLFNLPATPSPEVLARNLPVAIAAYPEGTPAASSDHAPDHRLPQWYPLVVASTGDTVDAAGKVAFKVDSRSLTAFFRCNDTRVIATLRERDADLWREDAFELFIDTEGWGRRYVELEVSPLGTLYDAHVTFARSIDFATSKAATLQGVTVKADTIPGAWRAEIVVPWRTLGLDGPPKTLRVNACRIDADGVRHSYQAWSPTYGWFHRPGRFGILVSGAAKRSLPK